MNKRTFLALAVSVLFAPLISFAAWSDPTLAPPNGNSSEPLNTSGSAQTKSGGIILNAGGATTGLVVQYGNVGINTASPTYRLQVQKASVAAPALMIGGGFAGGPRIQTYGLDADGNAWMGLGTDMAGGPYEHSLYFPSTGPGFQSIGSYNGTTYSEKMRITAGGNVGINSINPAYRLDVQGTIGANGNLHFSQVGQGAIGVYDPTKTQAVWSMGSAYVLPAGGGTSSGYGALYGLGWSYNPDYGGVGNNPQSKPNLQHQLLVMYNGVTQSAIGQGIWTNGTLTATGGVTASGSLTAPTLCLSGVCRSVWPSGITSEADTLETVTGRGNSTSQALVVNGNTITLSGTSPTMIFKDTDEKTAYWHTNSNLMYLLSGPNGAGNGGWATVNGQWPLTINLTNNSATHGGSVNVATGNLTVSAGEVVACTNSTCSYLRYTGDNNNYLRGNTYLTGILIDESNTFYSVDPSGSSQFNEVFSNSWLRNNNAGRGLYNQATARHFYSEDTNYWAMDAGRGLVLRNGHNSTITGYLYWDGTAGSNNFGLLTPNGAWGVRTYNGGMQLYGDVNASILRDSDNGGYYVDPNGYSRFNQIGPSIMYDGDNMGFYVNPAESSVLSYLTMTAGGQSNDVFYVTNGGLQVQRGTTYLLDYVWVQGRARTGLADPAGILQVDDRVNIGNPGTGTGGLLYLFGNGYYYGSWSSASDRRLKTNIVVLPNALEKLRQINGVSFDWKETGKHTIGVIAQDVEKVYPELVSTDEKTGMKTVEYQNLVAPLIEAIKEQQKQIEKLQAEVKALQK